jgi:hypothetical protein
VIVEIKALSSLDNSHLAQVIGYLAVTGCPIGTVRSRLHYAKSALRQAIEHRGST